MTLLLSKNIFRVIDSKSNNISEVYKDYMLKIDEKLIRKEKHKEEAKEASESNLDIFYAPPTQDTLSNTINKPQSGGIFDNILEVSDKSNKTYFGKFFICLVQNKESYQYFLSKNPLSDLDGSLL